MAGPKTLYIDIETSPILCWTWGLFKQNIGLPQIERDSHMITWSAKWAGDDAVMYDMLPLHKEEYKANPFNDEHICESVWNLLDEADIVIAQNGDRFDMPKMNARFLYHRLPVPSSYRTVDTLKIARGSLRLTSNKLDWMGEHLGMGRKIKTDFDLWLRCLRGDMSAWNEMVDYNIQDVALLEDVYMELRPWSTIHANAGLFFDDDEKRCVVCGSTNIKAKGFAYTNLSKFQRYICKDCGKQMRGRKNLAQRVNLLTNVI